MSANPVVDFVPDGVGRPGFAEREDIDAFVDMLERFENGRHHARRVARVPPDQRHLRPAPGGRLDDPREASVRPRQRQAAGGVRRGRREWAGSGVGHVTTRQNIQLHFVKEADAEKALRLLAEVGLTTREACGNSVRNITGCPFAGVARARAVRRDALRRRGHAPPPARSVLVGAAAQVQDRVRRLLRLRRHPGADQRPRLSDHASTPPGTPGSRSTWAAACRRCARPASWCTSSCPSTEVLEVSEAVVRMFHRLGNRKDKHKARIKWVVQKLGTAAFIEEYKKDLAAVRAEGGRPLAVAPAPKPRAVPEPGARRSSRCRSTPRSPKTNVRAQKQAGFSSVIVRLPKGDISPAQFRALAALSRQVRRGGDAHHQRAEPGDALRADLAPRRAAPRARGRRPRAAPGR